MQESEKPAHPIRNIAALSALALLLRMIALGYKPFWQDEVFSVLFVRQSSAEFWSVLKSAEMNMALYYILLRGWTQGLTSEAGVRLLSVLPGVLTVPVIYALGTRLYTRTAGIWAAALLTVNACAVVYSQEARGYSMLILFAALCSWAFLRVIDDPVVANCALYIALATCAFYCHFYAAFVVLAHVCSVLLLPRNGAPWKRLVVCWACIAAFAIPGARVIIRSHGSNLWWLPKPGLLEIYHTLTFLAAESGKAVGAVLTVLLLVPVVFALLALRPIERSVSSFRAAFAPIAFALPIFATLVLSLLKPMFFHRFLIICLVPLLLIAARGLDMLKGRRVGTVLAILIFGLSLAATASSYHRIREDWRGAAAFTRNSDDPVVFYIKDAATPFAYYRDQLGHSLPPGQAIRSDHQPSASDAVTWAQTYPRLWLVRFPAGPRDPVEPEITSDMLRAYVLCEQREFKGVSVSHFCVREGQKMQEFRISPAPGSSKEPGHTP